MLREDGGVYKGHKKFYKILVLFGLAIRCHIVWEGCGKMWNKLAKLPVYFHGPGSEVVTLAQKIWGPSSS